MDIGINLLFSVIGFIAGLSTGLLWKSRTSGDWVISFVVVFVVAVWASSFVVDVYSKDYDPPAGIYPLMTAVIGMLSAIRLKGKSA